jgi:hypothetical protein
MSNEDVKEIRPEIDDAVEDLTSDLRADDLKDVHKPQFPFVKPTIKVGEAETPLTDAQVIAISNLVQQQAAEAFAKANYDPNAAAQAVRKSQVPITDFSKMTLDSVYDLSVPIEAKPFMSADVLAIKLKDTNYEARWVNKNSQNLGDKIAKGFTYIVSQDLVSSDGIQTGKDASGHYSFNDVVAMKIDKATYYAALRAAHLRAVSTTNVSGLAKKAASAANDNMRKSEFGNDFANASNRKQMEFYDAGITV